MDSLGDNKWDFLSGIILADLIVDIPLGIIPCVVPNWSFTIFVFILFFMVIKFIIYAYWYKRVSDFKTFKRRVLCLMILTVSFFVVFPLLRVTFNTILFWLLLMIYILILVYSLLRSKVIFQLKERKPKKYKMILWTFASLCLLTIISLFFLRNSQDLLVISYFKEYLGNFIRLGELYIVGLLFPLLIIKL